jgi:hypothetical protein
MGLQDVFTAVQNQMATTMTALGETVPKFLVGSDQLPVEDSPPRVVWVPGRETIRGPHAQGGDGVRNPRPLRTRHCIVQAHIWGADIPATEKLTGHLVAALNDVGHGAWDATGGDWGVGQTSATRLGFVYVLDLEILIPLTRELDTFHVVTSIPITPEVDPPS